MKNFIVFDPEDLKKLNNDEPVDLYTADGKHYICCSKKYYEEYTEFKP